MSLKDEIEKLIRQEEQKIEERDQRYTEYHERQRQCFQSLRALLEEVVGSVDSRHIKSHIFDDRATLEVGEKKGDYFSAEVRWKIEPNFDVRLGAEKGESLFYEQLGFRVEETKYYDAPELGLGVSENNHVFNTEQETAEYIIKQIAEKMAHYRHLDKLAAQRAKKRPPNNGLEEDAP
ncbi:MAG: hypothetical protein ACREI2_13815 [Nitrospiraceae bacterium]